MSTIDEIRAIYKEALLKGAPEEMFSDSVLDVAAERLTHPDRGWTAGHDAEHGFGHLIRLSQDRLSRAYNAGDAEDLDSARHELVKAAALIVAAVDLIDAPPDDDPAGD